MTYYNLLHDGHDGGIGTGTFVITGANTFHDFDIVASNRTVTFPAGATTTLTTFEADGLSSVAPLSLQGLHSWNSMSLSVPSGTVSTNYLNIRDSAATGGATFERD